MKHLDKSFTYVHLQSWLGTGLLTSTGTILYSGSFCQSVEQTALTVVLVVYSWNWVYCCYSASRFWQSNNWLHGV